MESPRPQLFILADAPDALCPLFGISLLERLLRVGQRLGFREAIVLSTTPEAMAAHLAKPSWARKEVTVSFRARNSGALRVSEVATGVDSVLLVSAGYYCDARLLGTLAQQTATTLLVDSDPPQACARLWSEGRASARPGDARACPSENEVSLGLVAASRFRANVAALLDRDWLSRQESGAALLDRLSAAAATDQIETCDAARQPTYVTALRKHVRPVFFPAPSSNLLARAERFLRDAAQNGTLDFPGWIHAPIENWIVKRLCRTSITPNQVTFVTMLIGLLVTVSFATGGLWPGLALALTVGLLDGVDGKLARTKIETTAAGDWEHVVDFGIELSWWTALGYHFHTENLRSAYWLLLLLVGSDLVDRLAKRAVKNKVGRNLDDVSNFDRFVRWIGSRRNINIWILAGALALGDAANGFVLICWWGAATAAVHVVRSLQIRLL